MVPPGVTSFHEDSLTCLHGKQVCDAVQVSEAGGAKYFEQSSVRDKLKNASQIRVTLIRFGIDCLVNIGCWGFFSGMFHLYVSTGSGFGSVLTAT